jgi:hypothetical protein
MPCLSKYGLLLVHKLKPMLQISIFTLHDLNFSGDGNTSLWKDLSKRIVFVVNNVVNKF